MSSSPYRVLIFDIGDVLFTWSPSTKTGISGKTLKSILSSDIWCEYEQGRLSEADCYVKVGDAYNLEASEVKEAFSQARDSLKVDHTILSFLRKIKDSSGSKRRIYAMSNISKPDYEVLRTKIADWGVFDHIFASGEVGMRKPDLCFYKHVLQTIDVRPEEVIFVDDKLENVISAKSLGIRAIQFKDVRSLTRTLGNLLGNPILRGNNFLSRNAKNMDSTTDTGVRIKDNFAQLLILEATQNEELVALEHHKRRWKFFIGKPLLTTQEFPFDLDTTSAALIIQDHSNEHINFMLDDMLGFMSSEGLIMTFYDKSRPRIDPVVCVNVLRAFYKYGRGKDLQRTQQWIRQVLYHRAYLDGTRYYPTAEAFLYFLGRFLETIYGKEFELYRDLKSLAAERVRERIGADGDPLCLAMRILAGKMAGVENPTDSSTLRSMQCEDGGWDASVVYRYGSSGLNIGNRGLTTALAIQALETSGERYAKRRLEATVVPNTKKAKLGSDEARLEYFVHANAPESQVNLMSSGLET
ncbi:Haloacid dehalogenase-like hydrolase-domain-containing protein [Penicillium odoratum]|uniref:Haloacid dehalogenase-like hydrolase-domain-containing protein n=1 Tax=Penicillium odoratum TaxID=1167516 RepID=UPI002546DD39|nr:Haloacid dehalogenase-like hydrolase-domain-containing protein [Penicillium odoratum]KAJ5745274.1 Haloacid dehalogenase-like hydrolase-domain-containing protein [Penicillium odoratum]